MYKDITAVYNYAIRELSYSPEKIVVFESPKVFNRHTLRIFGRDKAEYSSRDEQFVLEKTEDGWVIKDYGITNPTFLNGKSLAGGESIIKIGDKIQVGPIEIVVMK